MTFTREQLKGRNITMKKILALLLSLTLLATLTSCAAAEEGAPLKVSLCVAETLGDLGFYDGIADGIGRAGRRAAVSRGHRPVYGLVRR